MLELLAANMDRFETCGQFVAEEMQMVFDEAGIKRKIQQGDNVVHAMAALQIAVLMCQLKED